MANKILKTKILLLNGSSQQWADKAGAVLKKGEPGVEFVSDVNPTADGTTYTELILKVGDGVTPWNKLPSVGKTKVDNNSLSFNDAGLLQIAGFKDASAATLPQKTADGKIEWRAVSAIVQGDGNTITEGDRKSIDTSETPSTSDDTLVASLHGFSDASSNQIPYKDTDGTLKWKNIADTDTKYDVASGEKLLKLNNTTFSTDLDIEIESSKIVLYGSSTTHDSTTKIAEVDASAFVKDGLLKNVILDSTTDTTEHPKANGPYLIFTWNIDNAIGTDSDTNPDEMWVSVKSLIDVYTGGTLISLNGKQFNHSVPSGAAAGDTSPSATQTPTFGTTFNIPVVTSDAYGHIVGKKTTTVKLPSITTTDSTSSDDDNISGLKITGTTDINIEIDDSVTFILDGGTAAELVVQ